MKNNLETRRGFLKIGTAMLGGVALAATLEALGLEAKAAGSTTKPPYSPGAEAMVAKGRGNLPVITKPDTGQVQKPFSTPKAESFAKKVELGNVRKVLVENLTGRKGLNVKPSVLGQTQIDIEVSGLSGMITTIRVVDNNDKVLCEATAPDSMKRGCSNKPVAMYVADEQVIYVADSPAVGLGDLRHEEGHGLDPDENRALVGIDTEKLNAGYWQRFLGYLNKLPSSDPDLGGYLFSQEKNVVTGYAIQEGEEQWPIFHEAVKEVAGVKPFFVPDDVIEGAIKSLPKETLPARALSWRKGRVEKMRAEGKRPLVGGFDYEAWGKFLMKESVGDTGNVGVLGEVKKTTQAAYSLARFEAYADLNDLRMTDKGAAVALWPEAVEVQEKVIAYLKRKDRWIEKIYDKNYS